MFAAQQVDDFIFHLIGHGTRHITFVQHGNDFQVMLQRHVQIRDSLRLHSLRSVHNEQRPFTGGYGTGYLV